MLFVDCKQHEIKFILSSLGTEKNNHAKKCWWYINVKGSGVVTGLDK